jgi:hypothetical protein
VSETEVVIVGFVGVVVGALISAGVTLRVARQANRHQQVLAEADRRDRISRELRLRRESAYLRLSGQTLRMQRAVYRGLSDEGTFETGITDEERTETMAVIVATASVEMRSLADELQRCWTRLTFALFEREDIKRASPGSVSLDERKAAREQYRDALSALSDQTPLVLDRINAELSAVAD